MLNKGVVSPFQGGRKGVPLTQNNNKSTMPMHYKDILLLARTLRKNQTPAEKVFWLNVRGRKFLGLKFLRQYIIQHSEIMGKKSYFIPDFYCHEKRIIVEIDGGIHKNQVEYDQMREEILKEMGYWVIRFKNEEILNDWSDVAERLEAFIGKVE